MPSYNREVVPGSTEHTLNVANVPNRSAPLKVWSAINSTQAAPTQSANIAPGDGLTTFYGSMTTRGYTYLRVTVIWTAGAETATLTLWDNDLTANTKYCQRFLPSGVAQTLEVVGGNTSFVDIPVGASDEIYLGVSAISGTCSITICCYN
jgi:hypothetical protein